MTAISILAMMRALTNMKKMTIARENSPELMTSMSTFPKKAPMRTSKELV